jgi:lysophospholipase L1-like esterase
MKIRYSRFFKITAILCIILLSAFKLSNPKKVNIVFLGDSITQGSNTTEIQPSVYAIAYLKGKLGTDSIAESNQGHSGHTTVDFLPGGDDFNNIIQAADAFYADKDAKLVFSVMLGTNDSAVHGTNGAPVSPQQYSKNLTIIINELLKRYPDSRVVINHPLWYSPNTQNNSTYLAEGLARLQTYLPEIAVLAKNYGTTNPGHVFVGDTKAFNYFKNNYTDAFKHEQGRQGIFYLHPNQKGAARLGELWGKAIYKVLYK